MPIQVYGMTMSTCTQRVLTTLIEKGLQYQLVNVDLTSGEHKVRIGFNGHECSRRSLFRVQNISRKNNHLASFLFSSMRMVSKFTVSFIHFKNHGVINRSFSIQNRVPYVDIWKKNIEEKGLP